MKALVTGGAGFIGRWVTARLLRAGYRVLVLDDLSNGRRENLAALEHGPDFLGLVVGDLKDDACLSEIFSRHDFDLVCHLGASIHVQRSIDSPRPTFQNDAEGTFKVLEACRAQYFRVNDLDIDQNHFDYLTDVPKLHKRTPRVAVMSTCMVYDVAGGRPIAETHCYRPASPYAAAKIGADMLALSYFFAYALPVTVLRPFNTYGPFQRSNSEGGVVSVFLKRDIAREPLLIKGSGDQTRDLLYVEDCADFVVRGAHAQKAEGHIINAGTGVDISINDLANVCRTENNTIDHVPHDHPQAEIMKLVCDSRKAGELLDWRATTPLSEGINKTRQWLIGNRWAW